MKGKKVAIITLLTLCGLFTFAKPSSSQKQQPTLSTVSTPSTVSTNSLQRSKTSTTPRRFKITVALTDLSDLKVKQGDRLFQGQILSDRTQARQQLEAKKRQLEIAIQRMSLPLSKVAELPKPDFAIEEAAIERAKYELAALDDAYVPETRFKTRELEEMYDKDILEKRAKFQESKARAAMQLNQAISQLQKARAGYQQQQYQHSLNLIRQQTNMQRQQYQLSSLVSRLQEVEAQLSEIVAVKSPYNGRVRRIKILGQTDRNITAEIRIHVAKDS